jgi:hypothetical protein
MLPGASLRIVPLVLGLAFAASSAGPVVSAAQPPATIRIGTFDSRAVALAYYRSPSVMKELAGMRAELDKAKSAGDQKKVEELQTRGPAMQMLMHQQGFSNGSIGNITSTIANRLPDIARAANVVAVVSCWEVPHAAASVELVDVTPQMVALFAPDAQTMKIIESMKGQKPIGLLDALMIKD